MFRRSGFALKVALLVVIGTLFLGVMFWGTHHAWYDGLHVDGRIRFWNEFAVAYGTLALAVVTWASVAETQQVLADEDVRFRRGRMPMLQVVAERSSEGGFEVAIQNVGDGAAREVRLWFDAHVSVAWNEQGTLDNQNENVSREHAVAGYPFASYFPTNHTMGYTFDKPERGGPPTHINATVTVEVRHLRIDYLDVFGALYQTNYVIDKEMPFHPQRFDWKPPEALVPSVRVNRSGIL